jgi:hypothetical protein
MPSFFPSYSPARRQRPRTLQRVLLLILLAPDAHSTKMAEVVSLLLLKKKPDNDVFKIVTG